MKKQRNNVFNYMNMKTQNHYNQSRIHRTGTISIKPDDRGAFMAIILKGFEVVEVEK